MNILARHELTTREVEVLRLAADGLTNQEIAGQLGLKEETVKSHMKHVYRVLGARNRAHAVVLGLRRGVIW